MREALFSILGERVRDARFLDLYAGSGAVGLEALSRGAKSAAFVERARTSLQSLEKNLATLAPRDRYSVAPCGATQALKRFRAESEIFDLIFVDPPYSQAVSVEDLEDLAGVATPDACLVIERRSGGPGLPSNPWWRPDSSRRYGDSELDILTRVGPEASPSRS